MGRRPYLILSLAMSTIVTLLFTQARSLLHFAILQVIGGISSSLYNIIVPALLTDLTKDIERGGRFGRLGGFGWLGSGIGYLVAGIILATIGFFSAFIFVAMLSLVACIIVQLFVFSYHLPSKEVFTPAMLKGWSASFKTLLVTLIFLQLTIFAVEGMVIPIYVVDALKVDRVIFGGLMATSYIIILGIILDFTGFTFPFLIRAAAYLISITIIYFKLKHNFKGTKA